MPSKKLLVPAVFVGILAFLAVTYFVWNYQKKLCYQKSAVDFEQTEKIQKALREGNSFFRSEFSKNSDVSQK